MRDYNVRARGVHNTPLTTAHGGWRPILASLVAQVLDMITEMQPDLRKLPFDEFVHVMCKELPGGDSVDTEIRETFPTFSANGGAITSSSLQEVGPQARARLLHYGAHTGSSCAQAMNSLGTPVSKPLSDEMIEEADLDGDGVVNMNDYCAMNNVPKPT